jgi:hypothetical protein
VDLSPGINPTGLLVGECHLFPPLKCGLVDELPYYRSGHTLLSGADWLTEGGSKRPRLAASKSPSFKVVIIDPYYNVHIFT